MATKLLVVSAAILVIGIINETNAQYRTGYGYGYGHHSHPYYQQPRPPFGGYPQQQQPVYQQQLPGVSVQEAEWVCKNPKTGDMMIISSEDVPTANTGGTVQQQWQPQPNDPQPSFPEPTAPPATPSYPTPIPQQPNTDPPNTNGEGLIEIRTRQ